MRARELKLRQVDVERVAMHPTAGDVATRRIETGGVLACWDAALWIQQVDRLGG